MPTYDYACQGCGPFEARRPIAERDLAAACPACGRAGARVLGAGPRLGRMGDGIPRSARPDDSVTVEGVYGRLRHRAGCPCC